MGAETTGTVRSKRWVNQVFSTGPSSRTSGSGNRVRAIGRHIGVRVVVALVAATVVTSACTSGSTRATPTPSLSPSQTSPPPTVSYDADRLVGRWKVLGAGKDSGPLILADGLTLMRSCGELDGDWNASTSGLFVAGLFGGTGTCVQGNGPPTVAWLDRVVGYRPDGRDGFALVDGGGAVVVRLRRTGAAASQPSLSAERRARLAPPPALPSGMSPARPADVVGRWRQVGAHNARSYLQFRAGAAYDGSDGCNGVSGRYVIGGEGVIVATQSPQTLIGCNNSPLPSWVAQAGRLGLRAGRLVFVDRTGKILGEANAI